MEAKREWLISNAAFAQLLTKGIKDGTPWERLERVFNRLVPDDSLMTASPEHSGKAKLTIP